MSIGSRRTAAKYAQSDLSNNVEDANGSFKTSRALYHDLSR
jgi:hypothetical protein